MVEDLHLTPRAWGRLVPRIRTKVKGCVSPHCWEIKEPVKSNEKIYLGPSETGRKNGMYASVRRVLFLWEYDQLPMRKIEMACKNPKCCNPAHARVPGYDMELDNRIPEQIKENKLWEDDAQKWYGYVPFTLKEKKEKPVEKPAPPVEPTELTEQERRDAEAIRQHLDVLGASNL